MKYKTMQGREIDMAKLIGQHELTPAVGNVRLNARGDELAPNGQIIRKREEIVAEYYNTNPKARSTRTVQPSSPAVESATQKLPETKTKKTGETE